MKSKLIVSIAFLIAILSACNQPAADNSVSNKPTPAGSIAASSPTPLPSPSIPKNGDYDGKGVVTKLNLQNGSVELDHEAVKDLMPAMRMEFFVTEKKMLNGVKVGDKVDFVLRYKNPTETIVNIRKAQ